MMIGRLFLLNILFQSTPPMRGATFFYVFIVYYCNISIHAPHAGSDGHKWFYGFIKSTISIHAPHAGSDSDGLRYILQADEISIHAPHAGSDLLIAVATQLKEISIHAPHAGSDLTETNLLPCPYLFQSTPPMRGATASDFEMRMEVKISIHAPHAGSDVFKTNSYYLRPLFQSTPPMRGATYIMMGL